MWAYSQDLRERAVASVERGECTVPEAAERYEISTAALERWLRQKRLTGSCAALAHAGGTPRKLAPADDTIRARVQRQPDVTLDELCDQVEREHGITSSPSMMCREVAHLDLRRKKSRSTPASGTLRRFSSSVSSSSGT